MAATSPISKADARAREVLSGRKKAKDSGAVLQSLDDRIRDRALQSPLAPGVTVGATPTAEERRFNVNISEYVLTGTMEHGTSAAPPSKAAKAGVAGSNGTAERGVGPVADAAKAMLGRAKSPVHGGGPETPSVRTLSPERALSVRCIACAVRCAPASCR